MKIQLLMLHAYGYPWEEHTLKYSTQNLFSASLSSNLYFIWKAEKMVMDIIYFKTTFIILFLVVIDYFATIQTYSFIQYSNTKCTKILISITFLTFQMLYPFALLRSMILLHLLMSYFALKCVYVLHDFRNPLN